MSKAFVAQIGGQVSGFGTIEGPARRTARDIAEQLKLGAQRQGWIRDCELQPRPGDAEAHPVRRR